MSQGMRDSWAQGHSIVMLQMYPQADRGSVCKSDSCPTETDPTLARPSLVPGLKFTPKPFHKGPFVIFASLLVDLSYQDEIPLLYSV